MNSRNRLTRLPLKAGIVGCGRMGVHGSRHDQSLFPLCWKPLSHLEAVNCVENLELVALCDTSPNAKDKLPIDLLSLPFYTSVKEIL